MTEGFVCHPDATVDPPVEDYPDTGCYTMSPDEFAAADTRQAWSQVEPKPYFNEPPKHGWAGTIKVVAAAAAAVLGAIVAAAVMLKPPGHVESTSVTQTVTATTAASPTGEADPGPPPGPFVMPTVMAAHETQDGDYLQRLRAAGLYIIDPAQAVRFARTMCENLANGFSVHEIGMREWLIYHEWPVENYERETRIGAAVYCPGLAR